MTDVTKVQKPTNKQTNEKTRKQKNKTKHQKTKEDKVEAEILNKFLVFIFTLEE